jgi:hypothetical protein
VKQQVSERKKEMQVTVSQQVEKIVGLHQINDKKTKTPPKAKQESAKKKQTLTNQNYLNYIKQSNTRLLEDNQ